MFFLGGVGGGGPFIPRSKGVTTQKKKTSTTKITKIKFV
jgi:hypothetical protein